MTYKIDGIMTATDEATAIAVVEILQGQGWDVAYGIADDEPHDYDDNAEFTDDFWSAVEEATIADRLEVGDQIYTGPVNSAGGINCDPQHWLTVVEVGEVIKTREGVQVKRPNVALQDDVWIAMGDYTV